MITNREIACERLLAETLDEVVASARENGVPEAALADELRARAAALEDGDGDGGAGDGYGGREGVVERPDGGSGGARSRRNPLGSGANE